MAENESHGKRRVSWWASTTPVVGPTGTATTWVGARYVFNAPGRIFGLRFYDGFAANDSVRGLLWRDSDRNYLRSVVYLHAAGSAAAAWRNCWFHPVFRVDLADIYQVAFCYRAGGFYRTNAQVPSLAAPVFHGPVGLRSSFTITNIDPAPQGIVENLNAHAIDVLYLAD